MATDFTKLYIDWTLIPYANSYRIEFRDAASDSGKILSYYWNKKSGYSYIMPTMETSIIDGNGTNLNKYYGLTQTYDSANYLIEFYPITNRVAVTFTEDNNLLSLGEYLAQRYKSGTGNINFDSFNSGVGSIRIFASPGEKGEKFLGLINFSIAATFLTETLPIQKTMSR